MNETNSAVLEQPPVETPEVPPAPETPAPAAPVAPAKPEQLGLIGFVDDAIGRVFGAKAITGKDGVNVGTSVTMRPQKDIAKAFNLEGKANRAALNKAVLGMSDAAFAKVRSEMVGLGSDWTLAKAAHRTLGSGIKQITIVVKEIKRNAGPSDEDIAKAWNCSVETVKLMRERQLAELAKLEANTVTLPADVKPEEAPKA